MGKTLNDILNAVKNFGHSPLLKPVSSGGNNFSKIQQKQQEAQKAVQTVRQNKPDYKGTDQQIRDLYSQYGPKLLEGINPPVAPPVVVPPPPKIIPSGTDSAFNYIRQNTFPQDTALEDYYPVLRDQNFMTDLKSQDQKRPGASNLLLMQAFLESTLGKNSSGLFGAKPGGKTAHFASPSGALDYQVGPNMLGGGANPNMNIFNEGDNSPLTFDRLQRLYQSYDPPGAYWPKLTKAFGW